MMKLAKENKHIRDRYVREHPDYADNHIYLIRGVSHLDKGYKSVTTWIKQFFEDFNTDAIIDKYYDNWQRRRHEKYYGKSKQDIKDMWEANRDDAATKGTHMHLQFELFFNCKEVEPIDELAQFYYWQVKENIKPWRTEMTVYSHSRKIVGNIDLITDNGDGTHDIIDFKRTDKDYDANFGRMCSGQLSDKPDCDATKHALQLSIYKEILEEKYGLSIKNLWNLYIKEDNPYNFVKREYIKLE